MLIENPDAFKTWLTSVLEPLCDADPAALAKYVYALVKKDKPIEDLRDGMLDQLDVFLQHETRPFVELLFRAMETQEYLTPLPPGVEDEVNDGNASAEEQANEGDSPARKVEVIEQDEAEEEKVQPERNDAEPEHVQNDDRLENNNNSRSGRLVRLRNRAPYNEQTLVKVVPDLLTDEPPMEYPRRRERHDMDKERRRRRSRSWERRATRTRRAARNMSPPPSHPRDRDREHRRRLRSPPHYDRRERERSRTRSRSRSRSLTRSPPPQRPRRCRDFDEKGYCMRGDLCQWDHGIDPVVLEDVAGVLAPPVITEYNPLAPNMWPASARPPPLPRELVPLPRIPPEIPPITQQNPLAQPPKKNFDFARLGSNMRNMGGAPCSLVVKKIPRGLNDIVRLSSHFEKFGTVTKIEVCFENDPEAALITYSTPTEANVAYKSTEAVFNNRFIKVFWFNPDNNKQENVPPGGNHINKQLNQNHQHYNNAMNNNVSHNKVLINKDNVKATAQAKEVAQAKQAQETKQSDGEKVKKVVDMRRRAHNLLETQLQQQRLLIQKLEAGNLTAQQKETIVEAIKSAQEGIEKLRKELLTYPKAVQPNQAPKKPKSLQEAQKEILDTELEIYAKQQEGEDVTELSKKVAELRRQQMALASQYKFRRPSTWPRPPVITLNTQAAHESLKVDRRAKALMIRGFSSVVQAAVARIAARGAASLVPKAGPALLARYTSRMAAERAAKALSVAHSDIQIEWITGDVPANAPPTAAAVALKSPAKDSEDSPQIAKESPADDVMKGKIADEAVGTGGEGEATTAEDVLLQDDDEEEDEERSWRR